MNLPNKLTISRLILVFVFAIFAFPVTWFRAAPWIAFVIYSIASATDSLDGYLARKNKQVTDFGKFLDPIADKLLVSTALIALIPAVHARGGWTYHIYLWATMITLAREFAVSGVRMIAASKGKVIAAGRMGKLKMLFQTISLIVLLFDRALYNGAEGVLFIIGTVILGIATVLTILSGLEYIIKNKELLSTR